MSDRAEKWITQGADLGLHPGRLCLGWWVSY
jgi:hypothetical protein